MIAYGQSQGKGGESTVTMNERRAEIMRILVARRATTMPVLARTFGVTTRTIQNDILALTVDYPLETKQGTAAAWRWRTGIIRTGTFWAKNSSARFPS